MQAASSNMSQRSEVSIGVKSFDDGPNIARMQVEEVPSSPRRRGRVSRRASTGSYGSAMGFGIPNQDVVSSAHSGASIYGYDEYEEFETGEQELSFVSAFRQGALSRTESERKLQNSLALMNDYKDRGDKLQLLKERFTTSKRNLKNKKRAASRRSSISSTYSSACGSISEYSSSFMDTEIPTRSGSRDEWTPTEFSIDVSQTQCSKSPSTSFNMSSNTLPVTNVGNPERQQQIKQSLKTDQIIESLVWFSFHTPRTVLEDLIAHELEIWKREHRLESSKAKVEADASDYKLMGCGLKRPDDDEGSLSSLSDDEAASEVYDGNFSESMLRLKGRRNANNMITLPKSVERESALLFVDMSGFTKLSTLLDVESLSRVINSYFDMITGEVIHYGGDILKFCGDAFFAEWKAIDEDGDSEGEGNNPLADLNASLASINEMAWDDGDDVPKIATCVLSAAKCATSIVKKFSDFQVTSASATTNGAMLNVHCGVGVGHLVGLHVGDYKEDQEEEDVELRREFLLLGTPIDQVTKAADVATDGEVMASPEAMLLLAHCCDLRSDQYYASEPVRIASRDETFVDLESQSPLGGLDKAVHGEVRDAIHSALQPYESLRMHCNALNHTALARLHLQMALYVHPVIRGDEMALSAAIQAGKISQPTETLESRHRAEAELRSVYTIFIKAIVSPRITGMKEVDKELYNNLGDIMHVTSRELDRYSGHLRQFVVDDKGVVLIATFGLRGSTFPNMVANNGLPATFAIHRALKSELKVENRIGATFGKVYCGVVGGVRRHEFAVMGAPVNLAARLMSSKVNKGILVDEAVRAQADARFAFSSLTPVEAKGYDKPVPILEPLHAVSSKKKKSSFPFIGRKEEKNTIISLCDTILADPLQSQSSMVFLMGESGMGKSALAVAAMEEMKKTSFKANKLLVSARSTSTETEQKIPLSSYRKVFMSIIHDFCEHEGTLSSPDTDNRSLQGMNNPNLGNSFSSGIGLSLQSIHSVSRSRRVRGLSSQNASDHARNSETVTHEKRPSLNRSSGVLEMPVDEYLGCPRTPRTPRPGCGFSSEILTQSLRDISADFRTINETSSRKLLPNALSMSLHNDSGRSKNATHESLSHVKSLHHRGSISRAAFSPMMKVHSVRGPRSKCVLRSERFLNTDDTSAASMDGSADRQGVSVPYFEKLCWVCEQLEYPYEYADIVGSQFLGLDGANPVTHVDGHIPTMDELVEFLALAFICIVDYSDLTVIVIDDFQWVDSFSWKIFRVLCRRGKKIMLVCAMRSHDKQALRRLSTAASKQNQLQSKTVEISLGPLDLAEIRELMATVLGHDEKVIPDQLCTDVFQRTGGLPVYVVQILENIKRTKTVEIGGDGALQWTAAGLKEKRAVASNKTGAVMEETFLSRFDVLDVRARKVLQTCAVLGLSFALSDVIQVHPEMEEQDIEHALNIAIDEMILIEQVEDEEDMSVPASSTGTGEYDSNGNSATAATSRFFDQKQPPDDRFFQFSHAMWRKNVLTTMLKERKIELHRLIAEAMEKDAVLVLEESDISRLLTLFDHWKSCGDFSKSAPLALAVGSRLEEWDLSAQSLELYEDALEMSFDSVQPTDNSGREEWVQVSAKPKVMDLILRLHIRIGLCHQRLADLEESITTFEDAYRIVKTASKIPGMSKSLTMPIISSLCVLKLEQDLTDTKTKEEVSKLLGEFMNEANEKGITVHIGRALSMRATYYAAIGQLDCALVDVEKLKSVYDFEKYSFDMIAEYGRDFALECFAESVQWLYLLEKHDVAEKQADLIVQEYLPLIDPLDMDSMMYAILPVVQVFKLLGRSSDADWLLKKYVINPTHDHSIQSEFWIPLFNPLAYLLEIILMEENEQYDPTVLAEMQKWVLDENNSMYDLELERKAHTLMGELCWRVAMIKEDSGDLDGRDALLEKARDLLTPIARYPHGEIFLKHTAQALLEAL